MAEERTMALEQPLQLPDPARPGWWDRFKGSRAGRALRVLILPFVVLASRIEAVLAMVGKLKYATAVLSMFISVGAYTLYWGLPFAAGFVLLLFVHEMGHVIQLRREGIRATAPLFIPFLGAMIGMREMPKHALAEARVGLAGPILGTVAALAALALAVLTDSDLLRALAYTGFFLNLFNLLPVSPLDGGRAAAAISPWLWLIGMAVLAAFLFLHFNPFLLIIVLIGGAESISRLVQVLRHRREMRRRRAAEPHAAALQAATEQLEARMGQGPRTGGPRADRRTPERYYEVTPGARALVALTYVSLAAVLVLGMAVSHVSHIGS